MSHNSKYYRKKLKPSGSMKITDFKFTVPSSDHESKQDQPSATSSLDDVEGEQTTTISESTSDLESQPSCQPMISDSTEVDLPGSSKDTFPSESPIFIASKIDLPLAEQPSVCPTTSTLFHLPKKQMTLDSKYESAFEWLYFSCSKNGYLCKTCELFGVGQNKKTGDSPFITGTVLGDHPIRKLEKHEESYVHQQSLKRFIDFKAGYCEKSIPSMFEKIKSRKADQAIIDINRKYISSLISTTNFVVHNHWALDSISRLMEHLVENDSKPVIQFKEEQKSLKYVSSTSVTDVLAALSKFFEEKLLDEIRNSEFITLLADESTDEANRNQFVIMIRFLDRPSCSVTDHFFGIVNVKRADAATLMDAITAYLQLKEIDINKVMFVGFDGCNTMSGQLNGLQRRFRNAVPHSLYINCRSHRLALCVKHLMKEFKILEEVDAMLIAVYKLFEYSPQKFSVFKDVQSSYDMKELVMVRAAATRWLSHGVACMRFINRFVQIVDTLDALIDRKREPEIIGLRDMVTNKNVVAAVLILCDILQPVNIFCKYLQGSTLDFSAVPLKLKDLTDQLHLLAERFRASLTTPQEGLYVSKMTALFQEIDDRTVYSRRLRDRRVFTAVQIVEELAVPICLKLVQELEDGFQLSPVLKSFSVLSLKHLPETIVELANYGKANMEILASHYGQMKEDTYQGHRSQGPPIFNKVTALAEYEGFKHLMFMARNRDTEADLLKMFLDDDNLSATYPAMFKLLLLSKLIPSSTASVERVFSLMNSTCTVNRNRLSQETLHMLLLLCKEGNSPLTEEQKNNIIDIFRDMRNRDILL